MNRSRRRRWPVAGTAVVLVAAGTVHAVRSSSPDPAPATTSLPTATVRRADLSSASRQDGTLGYAGACTVLGAGEGRVTWLPAAGQTITRDRTVYEDDGRAVPLFYGSRPFWRTMAYGVSGGDDVRELERNLVALGYGDGLTVDRTFTRATRSAIRRWQAAHGFARTGTIGPADVVVQPGAIRVTALTAVPGAPAAGTILTASGTGRLVTVNLPVASRSIVKAGNAVRVELPGGASATGHVASIGTVAVAATATTQAQTGENTETATLPVTITLDRAAGSLDGAPVTVDFTSAVHRGVLSVPVEALLASAAGTYSVNVVDDAGRVTAVPVSLGIFDGDAVEVTGNLTVGERVQVPAS